MCEYVDGDIVSDRSFPLYAAPCNGFTGIKIHDWPSKDRIVEVGYQDGKSTVYTDVHHVVKFPDSYRLTFMSEPGEKTAERISLPDRDIRYVKTGKLVGMRPDRRVGDSE